MTVSTTENRKQYNALATQDTFAYDFRVDLKADMEVYIDGVLEDPANWTITNLGNPGGGDVVLNTPLVSNASVTLLRNVALTQEVDYQPFDPFPAETHERVVDKLTFLVQQIAEKLTRIPQFGVNSTVDTVEMDDPVGDKFLVYNASGNKIISGPDAAGTLATFSGAKLTAPASQGISSPVSDQKILFNGLDSTEEVYDEGDWIDPNNSQFIVPAGVSFVAIRAFLRGSPVVVSETPVVLFKVRADGSVVAYGQLSITAGWDEAIGHVIIDRVAVNEGDVIDLVASNSSGADLLFEQDCTFEVKKVA